MAPNWRAWTVQVHLPQPFGFSTNLVLARDFANTSYTKNMLVCLQLHAAIFGQRTSISKSHFFLKVASIAAVRQSKTVLTNDPLLLQQLIDLGAIGNSSTAIKLMSACTASDVLRSYGYEDVAAVVSREVAQSVGPPGAMPPHNLAPPTPAPQHTVGLTLAHNLLAVAAPPAVPEGIAPSPPIIPQQQQPLPPPSPLDQHYYPTHLPFPMNLPQMTLTAQDQKCRYGLLYAHVGKGGDLSRLPANMPLKHELPAYSSFYSTPIQLDRAAGTGPVGKTTLRGHISTISKYMGYLQLYKGLGDEVMSLRLFSHQQYIMDFITFMWHRSNSTHHMSKELYKVQRVVEWLRATDCGAATTSDPLPPTTKKAHLDKVHAMVGRLCSSFQKAFPSGKPKADDADGTPAPPPAAPPSKLEVLRWQCGLRDRALSVIAAHPHGLETWADAEVIKHWCLSEWLCNNLPSVRLSCVRTMQRPQLHGQHAACTYVDCRRGSACRGNRILVRSGEWYSPSQSRVSLQPTPSETGQWYKLEQAATPAAVGGSSDSDSGGHAPPAVGWGGDGASGSGSAQPPPLHSDGLGQHMRGRWSDGDDGGSSGEEGDDGEGDSDYDECLDDFDELELCDEALTTMSPSPMASSSTPTIIPSQLAVMEVVLPHHKEEKSWGNHSLRLLLPYDLALTTYLYMKYAWPILDPDQQCPHLFTRQPQGCAGGARALQTEHLTTLWYGIQVKYAAPWPPFPPTMFRDIHIVDRVVHLSRHTAAAGMPLAGDAFAMQNNVGKVWEGSYCKHGSYFNIMAEGVTDRMTQWRHAQLKDLHAAAAVQPAVQPAVPGGVGDVVMLVSSEGGEARDDVGGGGSDDLMVSSCDMDEGSDGGSSGEEEVGEMEEGHDFHEG